MQLIKWDTEYLRDYVSGIGEQAELLEENRDFLTRLNEEVNEAWHGWAGTAFDDVMDVDIENYSRLMLLLREFTSGMTDVTRTFEESESEIDMKIKDLRRRVG